jgi:hypothetical protein
MRHQVVLCILLILYISFAYGQPPSFLVNILTSVPGKIVALGGLVAASFHLNTATTMLLAIAILISLPEWEFFESKKKGMAEEGARDTQATAPGKNIQPRRAPHVDTESTLRRPKITTDLPAHPSKNGAPKKPNPKLKAHVPASTEHFESP